MKLNYLSVHGFQGVEACELDMSDATVFVFCGPNACGKSSLRDAIQFALSGESPRVKLKKDYGDHLVYHGATKSKSFVSIDVDGVEYQRSVATGQVTGDDAPDYPALMPWLIGSGFFSQADIKDAQRVVQLANKVKITQVQIRKMMLDAGADETLTDEIMPFLRSGFTAAHKEAKNRVSECRGAWKAITGETFGIDKAREWKAEPEKVRALEEIEADMQEVQDTKKKWIAQREKLRAKGQDENSTPASGVDCGPCPSCGQELRYNTGKLYILDADPEKRPQPSMNRKEFVDAERMVGSCDMRIGQLQAEVESFAKAEERAEEKTAKAAGYLVQYDTWDFIASLMAPDGIPQKIMEATLAPIRERLANTSQLAGWKAIEIRDDLQVMYDGRLYAICSESEKWRADTAIAEALAYVSGIKLFAVDRMDILAPADRLGFLRWIAGIQADHDTIVILATLKSAPKPPPGFVIIWLGRN